MNLRSVANSMTRTINPNIEAIGRRFKGTTMGVGRTPIPEYYDDETVSIQLQPLNPGDIKHVDGLNLQGLIKSVHINGSYYGVNREMQKGGDLFIIDGKTWLLVEPMELWSDWSRCLVSLQVDS